MVQFYVMVTINLKIYLNLHVWDSSFNPETRGNIEIVSSDT